MLNAGRKAKELVNYLEKLKTNKNTMLQQITELPENIKEQVMKDLTSISFGGEENYQVHVLTIKERVRLCLQIRPESKFAAHDDTNQVLMDDWGIPKYILIEKV